MEIPKEFYISEEIATYRDDEKRPAECRIPVQKLFSAYGNLVESGNWEAGTVALQPINYREEDSPRLPIPYLKTIRNGPAFWSLAGIHGEEPAGPNALVRNMDILAELGNHIPVVVFPLCNPSGYVRNWRYFDEFRDHNIGNSVGDSDHLLLSTKGLNQPRRAEPSSPYALALGEKMLELAREYPPLMVIDHHEDEDTSRKRRRTTFYIYAHGHWGYDDCVGKKIVEILLQHGMKITLSGYTRFGEKIKNGIIANADDGSIDDFLAAEKIWHLGQIEAGPNVASVVVVENPAVKIKLTSRIAAHGEIVRNYQELLKIRLAQEQESCPDLPETISPLGIKKRPASTAT